MGLCVLRQDCKRSPVNSLGVLSTSCPHVCSKLPVMKLPEKLSSWGVDVVVQLAESSHGIRVLSRTVTLIFLDHLVG